MVEREHQPFPEGRRDIIFWAGDGSDGAYFGHKKDFVKNQFIVRVRPTPYTRHLNQIQESDWDIETDTIIKKYDLDLVLDLSTSNNANRFLILTDYNGDENTSIIRMVNHRLLQQNRQFRSENEALKRTIERIRYEEKQRASNPEESENKLKQIYDGILDRLLQSKDEDKK